MMLDAKPIEFLLNLFHEVVSIAFSFRISMDFSSYFLWKYSTSHVFIIYFLYHDIYKKKKKILW